MDRVFRSRLRVLMQFSLVAAAWVASTAPAVAQRITVQYWRGSCEAGAPGMCRQDSDCDIPGDCVALVCVAGAVGAICAVDSDCNVAGRCEYGNVIIPKHHTNLSWMPPAVNPVDVYAGGIGPGYSKGTWVGGGPWILNVAGCFLPDVLGNSITMSGPGDPNPPAGIAYYYVVSEDGGIAGLPNINAFGCVDPHVCNNKGWCEFGATPGAPCNVPADCPGVGSICAVGTCTDGEPVLLNTGCNVDADCGVAGVCQERAVGTFCTTDSGPAGYGGCAQHATCVGGANAGRLCLNSTECPGGGTCPAVPAGTTTPGQLCYNVAQIMLPGVEGCPPVGNPKRIVRVLPVGVIAGCP